MPEPWKDMALVGRVARPHGRRGCVVVNPETDFLEDRFQTGSVVYIRRHGHVETLTVTDVRFHQGRPIIGLQGIDTMNDAEALVDAELRVPSETLHPLPRGVYYRHDLVGCTVRTTAGRDIGRVRDVEGPEPGSRLVVQSGRGDVLIPMADEICVGIDIPGRAIIIKPPEGLIELNARPVGDRDRGI